MMRHHRFVVAFTVALAAILTIVARVPSAQSPGEARTTAPRDPDAERRHMAALENEVLRVRAGESTRWVVAGDDWVPIGPFGLGANVHGAVVNGRFRNVIPHPSKAGSFAAWSRDGGILSTTDGGRSWRWQEAWPTSNPRGHWIWDPSIEGTVYTISSAGYPYELRRSDDGGVTWRPIASISDRGGLAADPSRTLNGQTRLLVSTSEGILEVSGDGRTSRRLFSMDGSADVVLVAPRNPNRVFALAWHSMYQSADGGYSWKRLAIPVEDVRALAVGSGEPPRLYITESAQPTAVYGSADLGKSWVRLAPTGWRNSEGFVAIATDPKEPDTVYVGGDWIYRSSDAGASWTAGPPVSDVGAIAFDADGRMLVASGNGLFRAQGTTVEALNRGFSAFSITDLAAAGDLPGVFATNDRKGLMGLRGVTGWTQLPATLPVDRPAQVVADESAGALYAGGVKPWDSLWVLNRFDLSKLSASPSKYAPENGVVTWPSTVPILQLGPPPASVLYVLSDVLYMSSDRGASWSKVTSYQAPVSRLLPGDKKEPISPPGVGTALAVSPSSPGAIYAGTHAGIIQATMDGNRWVQSTWQLPEVAVNAIVAHPRDPRIAYSAFADFFGWAQSVYRTTDGGVNWVNISGNLPEGQVNDLAIDPDGPGVTLYAATDFGVYRLLEGATAWELFGRNLPVAAVKTLAYHDATDTLLAGTLGRGVYAISSRYTR